MIIIRIIAILVAIEVMLAFEIWVGAPWYISLAMGALGYLVTIYVSWAINEGRRLKKETGELLEDNGTEPDPSA